MVAWTGVERLKLGLCQAPPRLGPLVAAAVGAQAKAGAGGEEAEAARREREEDEALDKLVQVRCTWR